MARAGSPTVEVKLIGGERDTLERWARHPKSAQALALRCRIVLECASGGHCTGSTDRWGRLLDASGVNMAPSPSGKGS